MRQVQISLPTNHLSSTSQVTSQMISQVANELAAQLMPGQFSGHQLASTSDSQMQYNEAEQEMAVVDSSAMGDTLSKCITQGYRVLGR